MRISFHSRFKKAYKKLSGKERKYFKKRMMLFQEDEFHILLKNHKLEGGYSNYRSINVTGDLRAIYKVMSDDIRIFYYIGSHSELYS